MQLLFHMAFVQLPFQTKITFERLSEQIFPGISVSKIMIIASGMVCLYSLLILYLWPLIIEVDPEKNLKWFYPFTPSYWSAKPKEVHRTRSIAFKDD